MKKTFSSLHARTICHATENLEKVRTALMNTVGETDVKVSRTNGLHGNPITILEATLKEMAAISDFFARLSDQDLAELEQSLASRIDEGCNLFMRIDKQAALGGTIRLEPGDDVVSIRIKVLAFPSRAEVAAQTVLSFIDMERRRRTNG